MTTTIRSPRPVTSAELSADVVVSLPSRLDVHEVATLRHHLLQLELGRGHRVVLDGSAVAHADGAGLGFLVSAQRECEAVGARLILASPSLALRLAIELTSTARDGLVDRARRGDDVMSVVA